jgi:hypothetical protein
MNTNTGSWLAAHGKLWYDDPWYRTAWMVWPQAVGLLVFVSVWLFQPGVPGFIPWAKPFVETPRDVLTPVAKNPATGYRMRGRAYYFLNQFGNARADFEAALRIDAKDSDTISYMNDLKRLQR